MGHLEVTAGRALRRELQLREEAAGPELCRRTLRMMSRAKRVLKKHDGVQQGGGRGGRLAAAADAE